MTKRHQHVQRRPNICAQQFYTLIGRITRYIISLAASVVYVFFCGYVLSSLALKMAIAILTQQADPVTRQLHIDGANLFNFTFVLCMVFAVNVLVVLQAGRVYKWVSKGCTKLAVSTKKLYNHTHDWLKYRQTRVRDEKAVVNANDTTTDTKSRDKQSRGGRSGGN